MRYRELSFWELAVDGCCGQYFHVITRTAGFTVVTVVTRTILDNHVHLVGHVPDMGAVLEITENVF